MAVTVRATYPMGTARGATCYVCALPPRRLPGSDAGRERVLDLGVFIAGEGHLFVCESCVTEWSALLGMVTAEARDAAMVRASVLEAENASLRQEATEARMLVALVVDHRQDVIDAALEFPPVLDFTDATDVAPAVPAPARRTNTRKAKATA